MPFRYIHSIICSSLIRKKSLSSWQGSCGGCRATANFAQVQEQLQTQPEFLVCNRGVIINMSKVLRFEGDCIEMLDGTHLPVRQKDKNSLLAQFTQYQFRGMQREF